MAAAEWPYVPIAASAKDAISGKVASGLASAGGVAPDPSRSCRRSIQTVVNPKALRRNVVVEQALCDMEDPLARQPDPLESNLEVVRIRLVAPRRLGGHDPVELGAEAAGGPREEVVIAIRDDAEPEALVEPA